MTAQTLPDNPNFCFVPAYDVEDEDEVQQIRIVMEGMTGHVPTALIALTIQDAEEICDKLNRRLGLDREAWTAMAAASMHAEEEDPEGERRLALKPSCCCAAGPSATVSALGRRAYFPPGTPPISRSVRDAARPAGALAPIQCLLPQPDSATQSPASPGLPQSRNAPTAEPRPLFVAGGVSGGVIGDYYGFKCFQQTEVPTRKVIEELVAAAQLQLL